MRIIIAGGTGFIGRELCRSLQADLHELIVLSRNPAKSNLPAGVQSVQWDGRTADGWSHFLDGADAIVNLAGESIGGKGFPPARWTAVQKQRILQSRLQSSAAIVAAIEAVANKPKVLIQSSGIDYYGHVASDQEIDENGRKGVGFLSDVTLQWEAATQAVEAMGVRRAIIRTASVLSLKEGPLPQMLLPFKLFAGGPFGNGQQWFSWIHIEDQVRAIRFLIGNEAASGPFNLCAPHTLRQKEAAKLIGQAMSRPAFVPAPAFALRLMLGEMADLLLNGRRAVPKRLLNAGFTFKYPHLADALADLFKQR